LPVQFPSPDGEGGLGFRCSARMPTEAAALTLWADDSAWKTSIEQLIPAFKGNARRSGFGWIAQITEVS